GRVAPAALREEVQEVPLRHERDEAAAGREVGEVGDDNLLVADIPRQLPCLLVGAPEKLVPEAELAHQLQRQRVGRLPPALAQEIGVLLEDHHVHASPSEEQAQHHAGRPAASDTAADLGLVSHWVASEAGLTTPMAQLPLVLIPAYLVPLFIILHFTA